MEALTAADVSGYKGLQTLRISSVERLPHREIHSHHTKAGETLQQDLLFSRRENGLSNAVLKVITSLKVLFSQL